MDVSLITPKTENLLVTSLRAAISDVNTGMSPNDALAKHASQNALGPELSCRLVEAFNTSKTLSKLRNTEGEKRAESFDLADRDVVVSGLYTAHKGEKKASAVRNDPSKVNFNTRPQAHNEKVAAAGKLALSTENTKQSLYGLKNKAIVAGRGFLVSIKHARDDYRMTTKRAKEDVASALHEFVNTFKRADRSSMSPLKDVEERLSYHFGELAKKAMDLAWAQLPERTQLVEKRAESIPTTHVYPLNDELYKRGETLIRSLKDAGDLQADLLAFNKKAALVEKHFKTQVDLVSGRIAGKDIPVESILTEKISTANDLEGPDVEEPISDSLGGLDDKALTSATNGLFDFGVPEVNSQPAPFPAVHEGKLRAIKTKLMLNDLISNDPVISGYPAEQVFTAYNQLSGMVPALATQPVAIRGLLANMLQREGGLEAMEVSNLLSTEDASRRLRVLGG